jgi:hypothetical protein
VLGFSNSVSVKMIRVQYGEVLTACVYFDCISRLITCEVHSRKVSKLPRLARG